MNKNKKFDTSGVMMISFAHFLHDVYSSFLSPLLPLIIEKFSISYSMAGLLTVFLRLPSTLNILIGILADKMPIRYLLILSPAITAVSMSLIGVADSYALIVILLIITGFSASMFHVPAPVAIKHLAGNRIGKGMSFFMFGGEIARTIGPMFILGVISWWGFEKSYRAIPIGLLASLLLYVKVKDLKISESIKKGTEKQSYKSTFTEFKSVFITIAGIAFFSSMIKASLSAFLPTYFTSTGNSLWAGGIALSVFQLAGALGTFSSGTFSDKFGRKNTLLIMAIISPILMWIFVSYSTEPIGFILLLLLGFFLFASTPVLLALVNDYKTTQPAFINGVFMTINFLSSAITIMIIGFLADIFGMENTYKISALAGILAIPFIFKVDSTK